MTCPRCNHDDIKTIAKSPEGDAWEMYACQKCWYSWRSTETPQILDKFMLDDAKIAAMQIIPPVPPLKK